MYRRFKFLLAFMLFLSISHPALAQPGVGEGGGNEQSPIQVIVQIVITAIVLRVLHIFKLP
jgi:hypothetical protein